MSADTPDFDFLALLDRYVAGECSQAEALQVREWLALAPENRLILDEIEQFRSVIHARPPRKSAEDAWKRAELELGLHGSESPVRIEHRSPHSPRISLQKRRTYMPGLWAAAASIAIIASGAIYFANSRPKPVAKAAAESKRYVTSRGQRATIQLPDGSQLTIGPSSAVDVAADYGFASRDLTLAGEAYFKVHHDAAKPFRVRTANGTAEDLGTEFVVSAFTGSGLTQVVVSSGKVALGGHTLTRGQLGRIDQKGIVAVSSGVDLDLYFGWIDGRLTFRDAPLNQALPRLTRWYDIEFQIDDPSLGRLPLTASFKDESLAQVLETLDLTLGLEHRTNGRRVTFYRRDQ